MSHPTPAVVNLTQEMKAAVPTLAPQHGLYVQFLVNTSDDAVYDRSGGPEGADKVVIKPRGHTLAFGKFVDGLLAHRTQEAAQLHRLPKPGNINPFSKDFRFAPEPELYAECLQFFVALDLGAPSVEAVGRAEDALREALEAFLREEGYLVLDRSGGYCRYDEEDISDEFLPMLEAWTLETFERLKDEASDA